MFVHQNYIRKFPCVENSQVNHKFPYILRVKSVITLETSNLFVHMFKVPMLIIGFPNTLRVKSVIKMETSNSPKLTSGMHQSPETAIKCIMMLLGVQVLLLSFSLFTLRKPHSLLRMESDVLLEWTDYTCVDVTSYTSSWNLESPSFGTH